MKRKINRLVVMFFAVIFVVTAQTGKVSAENYSVEDGFETEKVESDSLYSVEPFEVDRMAVEDFVVEDYVLESEIINAEMAQAVVTMDEGEDDDPEPTSNIYSGTMTGYLSATDTYKLYPANLDAGDYLQARLTSPNNSAIDYDLLIFDSNLSLIMSSDYVTYINNTGTLQESVGYIAETDSSIYICVYSVSGGSTTEAYTLDYTITTNFSGENEPSENAKEATSLTLGTDGAVVTAELNSPIDNDWYSFVVLDSPAYHKIRLSISSSSNTNGCNMEIYRNLVSTPGYYGMQFVGSGNGGEITLPAGTYYLRVVSTNTFNNFNPSEIPAYSLSVVPVSRVDEIYITEIKSNHGTAGIDYGQGPMYRVEGEQTNFVVVKGFACYYDSNGVHMSANVIINGGIENKQQTNSNLAWVYSSNVTNSEGSYRLEFYLRPGVGALTGSSPTSHHYYDIMEATVNPYGDENNYKTKQFYYLVRSIR